MPTRQQRTAAALGASMSSSAPTIDEPAYPGRERALFMLGTLVLAYIISFIDRQILALLVAPIKADLGISDFQISLLQGLAFAVFFCILGIPFGRLADRYSRKHIIAGGIFLWSLMTIACGLADDFLSLFLARMGVGVGEAALAPAAYSLIADSFRRERLVRATSTFALGGMLGAGLAFIVGGAVIEYVTHTDNLPFGLTAYRPWQLTFMIVGLPGFLVAALVLLIKEPARRGVKGPPPATRAAFAYLWANRAGYAPLYLAATSMAVLSYGGITWMPTHMMRSYGLSPGEAGTVLGIIHMAGPALGVTLGTMLSEYFARKGRTDGPLRTVMITSALAAPCYVAPLMPTFELTAALWFIAVVLQNGYYGNTLAALQMITPNQLRATNAALLTLVVSLCGLGFGAAAIGGLSDTLFAGDARGIGKAMALVGVLGGAFACIFAARGLAPYRMAIDRHDV